MFKNALIISPEFGLAKGGIQTWAFYLKEMLRRKGVSVGVFSPREPSFSGVVSLLRSCFFINSPIYLMTWKMAVVAAPSVFFRVLFRKRNLVIFVHGDDFLNVTPIGRALLRFLAGLSSVILVSNSHAVAELFYDHYGCRCNYIKRPIVEAPLLKDVPEYPWPSSCELKILTLTRLVKRKNIDSVIAALDILKHERAVNFHYVIAGAGPAEDSLKEQVKERGLCDCVTFLGKVSEGDKWALMKTADLFVLPSLYVKGEGSIEGYGIVYIESNAMGTPVISGDTGGVCEAVIEMETGILCDGSAAGISQAVARYLECSFNRQAMVAHADRHSLDMQVFEGEII